MSCVNACICSGNCLRCDSYKKEEYVGHAEDLYDYLHGRQEQQEQQANEDWMRKQKEAYYEEMNAMHEKEMQEMFEGGEE